MGLVLKVWPFILALMTGYIFYLFGMRVEGEVKSIFLSISAAFFAVPCLFLIYEMAQKASKKSLNKEIFDYAKMIVDREAMHATSQLIKSVYPYESRDPSLGGIDSFLSLEKSHIKGLFEQSKYIGFQAFKSWELAGDRLNIVLSNAFILKSMSDEQIVSVVALFRKLRQLQVIHQSANLITVTDEIADGFNVLSGTDISARNTEYPDRYVLVQKIDTERSVVIDHGDFPVGQVKKLLFICKINDEMIDAYVDVIYEVIEGVVDWLNLTGNEFIVDDKEFRLYER